MYKKDNWTQIWKMIGFVIFIFILTCSNNEENLNLATFNGGAVSTQEYIDHYLLSTKYKPQIMPSLENLQEIVLNKAFEKMAVLEATARGFSNDTTLIQKIHEREAVSLYQIYMQEEIINLIITDSLIKKFHSEMSLQYNMRYIIRVIPENASTEYIKSQEDTINWIYDTLRKGEKFEELAKKYSQDIQSAPKGGDLGFVIKESMGDAKLREVMEVLSNFSYSQPFRGVAGFYILYKGEQRTVPVPSMEKVRSRIWQTIYRTRRHNIEEKAESRFDSLSLKYNYQVQQSIIDQVCQKLGHKVDKNSQNISFNLEKISDIDFSQIIANFKGGNITVGDIFQDRKKRPFDLWELKNRLKNIAQQRIFSLEARKRGFDQGPKFLEQSNYIRNGLLRQKIYQIEVKDKVQVKMDSIEINQKSVLKPADLKNLLDTERLRLERELRSNYENFLKEKYQFTYLPENFQQALIDAKKKKTSSSANQNTDL
ncbi:peptidylprolyl isomerase [candidate division KSB1 bacterium]|nr:peptidylprolyl isomerase [candidate division KSB1 bacterium]